MRRKGFTLIEILIVIAIIGILAALLFPVFAGARNSARKATDISNGRQLAIAMALYTADYDGIYASNNWGAAFVLLDPYLKSTEVWRGQSHSGVFTVRTCYWDNFAAGCDTREQKRVLTGWLLNNDVVGGFFAPPRSSLRVTNPSQTVLLAENHVWGAREAALNAPANSLPWTAQIGVSACYERFQARYNPDWNISPTGTWPTGISTGNASRLGAHHNDGLVIVFADGHAAFRKEPPNDCSHWMPSLESGVATLSEDINGGCRPAGQPQSWCFTN